MSELYDRAEIYDLLENEERHQGYRRHWESILSGKSIRTVLDVSIGTGNLTLPLAELGMELFGSDLSEAMLERCKEKAQKKGLTVDLRPCDFRTLGRHFRQTFDLVASTGNSLPHVKNEDVFTALEQMDALVRPGGYLYFDTRNWDKILETRLRFYLYNPTFLNGVRINLIQVWDYLPDGSMCFNLLYTFERDGHIFRKEKFEEHYFPIRRRLLLDKLERLGYREIQVFPFPAGAEPADATDAGWYCVIAKKQEDTP